MRSRFLSIALSAIFTFSASAADLRVHAAASLADVLTEIGAEWEKGGGARLRLNPGASSLLARQIEEGAPGDVFFSADEAKMDALEKRGLVVPGSRRSFLSNSLVVIVPQGEAVSLKRGEDLASGAVERIAIAEPSSVPAGIYAKKWLEGIGVWDKVSRKLVTTENVRGALLAVEGGNVDAGIVYRTDAMVSGKVRVAFEVSGPDAPAISYPVAVLAESTRAAEARRFVAFLETAAMKAVFRRHGFVVR